MRTSAISISSNSAEGSTRKTHKDQYRYTQIAYSSLMEMLTQLIIATDLNYMSTQDLDDFRIKIEELSNKLNAFHKSQLVNIQPNK